MKSPQPESIQLRVELAILGTPARFELEVPRAPVQPRRLLPLFQAITNEIVGRSARASEARGKAITCCAGCGACCRQLVPISETEAHRLAELVEASPAPRRDLLRARFADARRRLEAAGLWERLLAHRSLSDDEAERLGLDYFRAGVACPFLEDESCSIHPDRPLSCREFLVTSPAVHCQDPTPETIDPVAIPSHASDALARIDPVPEPRQVFWMPLVRALDLAAEHPDPAPARPANEILDTFLGLLVALSNDAEDAGVPAAPPQRPARAGHDGGSRPQTPGASPRRKAPPKKRRKR